MSSHIEVEVKKTEPRTVAYIGAKGSFTKVGETIGQLVGWIQQKGYTMTGTPLGLYYNAPEEVPEDDLLWEVQWPLSDGVALSEPDEQGAGVKRVEACEVASTVYKGPYQDLGQVYGALVQWIMENGYDIAGAPEEVYLNDPSIVPQEEILTEVRFPVRKK